MSGMSRTELRWWAWRKRAERRRLKLERELNALRGKLDRRWRQWHKQRQQMQ